MKAMVLLLLLLARLIVLMIATAMIRDTRVTVVPITLITFSSCCEVLARDNSNKM